MKSVAFMGSISGGVGKEEWLPQFSLAPMNVLQQQSCLKRCSFETLFVFEGVPRIEVLLWTWAHECCKRTSRLAEQHNSGLMQRRPYCFLPASIIELMRAAIASMGNGLVSTAMPGASWPWPTAAFSA
jgi:hypothetical protein